MQGHRVHCTINNVAPLVYNVCNIMTVYTVACVQSGKYSYVDTVHLYKSFFVLDMKIREQLSFERPGMLMSFVLSHAFCVRVFTFHS